jgi:hypothetical protein
VQRLTCSIPRRTQPRTACAAPRTASAATPSDPPPTSTRALRFVHVVLELYAISAFSRSMPASERLPDGVSWTQGSDGDIEVTVSLPEDATRAKLRVKCTADTLTVHRGSSGTWHPVVSGSLRHAVEYESCCWAIEKQRGGRVVVIQLEKQDATKHWDALLRADVTGSILEELGRDQVIVDAGADVADSAVCGRCGALVKSSRMHAHMTMWCEALASEEQDGAGGDADKVTVAEPEEAKGPASHLYWSRSPTNPAGPGPTHRVLVDGEGGQLV